MVYHIIPTGGVTEKVAPSVGITHGREFLQTGCR
jgi:hypothetical protein